MTYIYYINIILLKYIFLICYKNKSARFVQLIQTNKAKLNIEIIMFLEFHCGDVFSIMILLMVMRKRCILNTKPNKRAM